MNQFQNEPIVNKLLPTADPTATAECVINTECLQSSMAKFPTSISVPSRRQLRKLLHWIGYAIAVTCTALLLLWLYTGKSPAKHYSIITSNNMAKLHVLPLSVAGSALCLDGSPPAVFVSHTGPDWVIYLGQDSLYWCLDEEDCLARSRTPQGSSQNLPDALELGGLLSNSPEMNPDFHSWSKAVIHACDGSGFLGYRAAPFYVSGKVLYSRGYHLIWSTLDWLRRRYHSSMQPHKARLLFVGQGSSGIALMLAASEIMRQFPYNRVKFAVEGSVLIDKETVLIERLRQMMATHHVIKNPSLKDCLANQNQLQRSLNSWQCLMLANLLRDVGDDAEAPRPAFFFSGSNYDRWLAVNVYAVACPIIDCRSDEESYAKYERLRNALVDAINPIDKKSERDSIWMCSCWSRGHLVHDALLTKISVEGWSLASAISRWYFTDKPLKLHLVDGQYPSNPTCPV